MAPQTGYSVPIDYSFNSGQTAQMPAFNMPSFDQSLNSSMNQQFGTNIPYGDAWSGQSNMFGQGMGQQQPGMFGGMFDKLGGLLGKADPKYGSAMGGAGNLIDMGSKLYGMWESHNRNKMMKEMMDKQYSLALANYDAQAQSYNDKAKITNTGLRMGGFGTQIRGQKNSKNQIA